MSLISTSELVYALPEVLLSLVGLILVIHAAFSKKNSALHANIIALLALGVSVLFLCFSKHTDVSIIFNGLIVLDSFGFLTKVIILVGAILSILMIIQHLDRYSVGRPETGALIIFSVTGMMIMVSAHDFMSLFLGLEMQSLSIYILAALHRDDLRSNEAALKYFVLGALSSALILYGVSLIYGFSGTTNFDMLADVLRGIPAKAAPLHLQFGVMLILCGVAFKVSAVPFHMWTPDVYEGVPTPIVAFFASVPKVAAFVLLTRLVMGPFDYLAEILEGPLSILSVASILVGSTAAIFQKNLKRLLAYSSIGHVGFLLLGLVAHNDKGISGTLLYLIVYMLMSLAIFGCVLSLKKDGKPIENLADLAGLSRDHPMLSLVISGLMLSLAGIPPLAGFFGKFFVIMGLVNAGYVSLAVIAILGSVIGAFYYIRIIKVMYFEGVEETEPGKSHRRTAYTPATRLALATTLMLIAFCSILPKYFYNQTIAPASLLLQR